MWYLHRDSKAVQTQERISPVFYLPSEEKQRNSIFELLVVKQLGILQKESYHHTTWCCKDSVATPRLTYKLLSGDFKAL